MGIVKRTHPNTVKWQKWYKQSRRLEQSDPLAETAFNNWLKAIIKEFHLDESYFNHLMRKGGAE